MLYAFDLDGTLFDTRKAVEEAYLQIGLVMPVGAYGKSWREWLPQLFADDLEQATYWHDQKNKKYLSLVSTMVKPLPLYSLFATLVRCGGAEVILLTGASYEAVHVLSQEYVSIKFIEWYTEQSVDSKIKQLNISRTGIMFEDDIDAAQRMRKETKWTIFHSPR